MSVMEKLSDGTMYLICGGIIAFVALVCVVFAVRAWREGKAMGMDTGVMKKVVTSSAAFSVLPAVAIALPKIAMVMKYLRNSVLEEVNKDYMKTAVASGSTKRTAMWRHAFKNAIIPVITFSTMMIGEILSGSIIVEQVFSVQGIGRLMITGISMRDYPVITALVLYIAFIVIVINMLGDIAYRLADPRLRRQKL